MRRGGEERSHRAPRRSAGRDERRRPLRSGPGALVLTVAVLAAAGCLDPGEPTPQDARVTWAAFPETVATGRPFAFEAAGPLAPNTCSRFDTLVVRVSDSTVTVSAGRLTYTEAWCSDDRVSFYQVRELAVPRAGRYRVRTAAGDELGPLVVRDGGPFSPSRARGEGTVRYAAECFFFGPGWAHGQRPFPLRGATDRLRSTADTDTVVWVEGEIRGFERCGGYGTRPAVRVDSVHVTDRTADDWY